MTTQAKPACSSTSSSPSMPARSRGFVGSSSSLDIVPERTILISLQPWVQPPGERDFVEHLDDEANSKEEGGCELDNPKLCCALHIHIVARLSVICCTRALSQLCAFVRQIGERKAQTCAM